MALDGIVLFEQGLVVSRIGSTSGGRSWPVIWSSGPHTDSPTGSSARIGGIKVERSKNSGGADVRLTAVDVLLEAESWADVVRESQEIVELALKALLRSAGIDPPRVHDVSDVLLAERERLPEVLGPEIESLAEGSRKLRRDRELAFYGAEDLTPSGFYSRADAEEAREIARTTVALVKPTVDSGA